MELFQWMTATYPGKMLFTTLVAMVPVIECRGSIPLGVGLGLSQWTAFILSVIGNMIPIPFILLFIQRILFWMKKKWAPFRRMAEKLEAKANAKQDVIQKYGTLGLAVLVAIPLPGTGAWTGALVAALLGIRMKRALPAIALGVLVAATIVIGITFGFTSFFLK